MEHDNSYGPTDVENAIQNRDWELLIAFLYQDRSVINLYTGSLGEKVIHEVVACAPLEIIEKVILLGADLTDTNMSGETAIFAGARRSAREGNNQVVSLLLKYGAKVWVGDNNKETPIAMLDNMGLTSSNSPYDILFQKIKKEQKDRSDQLVEEAKVIMDKGDVNHAVENLENAISLNRSNGEASYELGKIRVKQGNAALAQSLFIKAFDQGVTEALISAWELLDANEMIRGVEFENESPIVRAVRMLVKESYSRRDVNYLIENIAVNNCSDLLIPRIKEAILELEQGHSQT